MIIRGQFTVAAEDYANRGGILGYPICSTPMVEQVTSKMQPKLAARENLIARAAASVLDL